MSDWKTLSSAIVHENPWYHVKKDVVIRPDGSHGEYYVAETNGASVFVVVINAKEEILLIGQHRYTTGKYSWEVPGGNSDGQDPKFAAVRELKEETGVEAKVWEYIGSSFIMDGISNEQSHIFKASELTISSENNQEEEGISQTKWCSLNEIKEMIKKGVITDNQTITSIAKTFLVT